MKQDFLTRTQKRKLAALLREAHLEEARSVGERLLRANRTDAETLSLLGTVYRRLGRLTDAEGCCRQALRLKPRLAEAQLELGATLHCQGRMPEAMERYRAAIQLQPGLLEAHYLLSNALREAGLLEEAAGRYRAVLHRDPAHVAALCNLGGTLIDLYQLDEAAGLLNEAHRLRPDAVPVLHQVVRVLLLQGRSGEAEARCREALRADANAVDSMAVLADLLERSSRLEEAGRLVERGLEMAPGHLGLRLAAAKLARRRGDDRQAVTICEAALRESPPADSGSQLHHLLGQLFDHLGDTARAFEHFTEGNRITAMAHAGREQRDYLRYIAQQRERFRTAPPPLTRGQAGGADDDAAQPVFLVGFPRSGTTLLEQILDSHPQIQTLDERPTVAAMIQEHERVVARHRDAALALTSAEIQALRDTYFGEVGRQLTARDPERTLVDKMPLNLVDAHLIWRIFPEAKFILAIRHPCDACLSCFMQDFIQNKAMVNFTSLAGTAAVYAAVMDLWLEYQRTLPLKVHRIRYEDLVDNLEEEMRRLLRFLEIEWDPAVLDHVRHARDRGTIRTPSYHQVTQPIYQSAKYRWERYARELEPILGTLCPYIEHFGYRNPHLGGDAV